MVAFISVLRSLIAKFISLALYFRCLCLQWFGLKIILLLLLYMT